MNARQRARQRERASYPLNPLDRLEGILRQKRCRGDQPPTRVWIDWWR